MEVNRIQIILDPSQDLDANLTEHCYLVLAAGSVQYFSTTVKPQGTIFIWKLPQKDLVIETQTKSLEVRIIHYDTCRQFAKYVVDLKDLVKDNDHSTYGHFFSESPLSATVNLQLSQIVSTEASIPVTRLQMASFARNSKKTNTTNYQQTSGISMLEKMSSLKQIGHSPRNWYLASAAFSPKHRKQSTNIRSYFDNLDRKLFTSMDFQRKATRRPII